MVFIAIAALGGLTLVLATLLIVANRKLYVYEDPRIDVVEELLPGANCGACGLPGCRPFAEALVNGKVQPAQCTVSTETDQQAIADYLGVALGESNKQVARLACAGGSHVARNRALYTGVPSCRAAALVSGGGKGCSWGCLGFGDCEQVCDFDAITMDPHGLPIVDEEKCTACGDCVEVCPKDLFSIRSIHDRLWVACKNEEAGDEILAECEVACTACGKCAMDGGDLITMENNLPVVHYGRMQLTKDPIQRCPTGAIVWLDPEVGPVKGIESRKVIRKGERQAGHT